MARMSEVNRLSDSIDSLNDRIDALEMRLTYQDVTIETLNQTVTAQWAEIDRLTRKVAELKERLREAENNMPGPANERPPHY
jgi:SlyX protein